MIKKCCKYTAASECVHVCVHSCACTPVHALLWYAHVSTGAISMCVCIWRSEVIVKPLPQSFTTLFLKTGSATESGTCKFG